MRTSLGELGKPSQRSAIDGRSPDNVWALLRTLLQRLHAELISRWLVRGSTDRFEVTRHSATIVSPHPDDETLGCGGLIALKRSQDVPVQIVFLTDGTAAPAPDAAMTYVELAALRRREAVSAARILSVEDSDVHFLEGPDGTLGMLSATDRAALIERLRGLLKTGRPGEVFVTHRRDCHPDHEAAYGLVREAIEELGFAVELFEYPIWMTWSAPVFFQLKLRQLAGARRLEIETVIARKLEAIDAYRSQCVTLPRGFLDRFQMPYEVFFHATESN